MTPGKLVLQSRTLLDPSASWLMGARGISRAPCRFSHSFSSFISCYQSQTDLHLQTTFLVFGLSSIHSGIMLVHFLNGCPIEDSRRCPPRADVVDRKRQRAHLKPFLVRCHNALFIFNFCDTEARLLRQMCVSQHLFIFLFWLSWCTAITYRAPVWHFQDCNAAKTNGCPPLYARCMRAQFLGAHGNNNEVTNKLVS